MFRKEGKEELQSSRMQAYAQKWGVSMGGSQLLDKSGPRASSIPTAKPYPPGPARLPTPSSPPTEALAPWPCPLGPAHTC